MWNSGAKIKTCPIETLRNESNFYWGKTWKKTYLKRRAKKKKKKA